MNNVWNTIYMILLGIVAIFTGEIVTFIMLGFVLVTLNNIHTTLKNIYKVTADREARKYWEVD
ncbi:hypothetical protein GCM10007216_32220 [Thalassobacillus devorans]|uniref:TMhelix containing protein n=1 Tax=Thalassobacillus devorans TaxID=279813 RepID=A0ABQ1PLL1_9BACI|nr:hypothetical protein [Thalassobacillus devorans]NIK30183.1 hypothetical protein [Thalassobacillus devorans]GGC98973.1 hypothetical protein GCM10007216_32220 [Thalassobacillus devorans]